MGRKWKAEKAITMSNAMLRGSDRKIKFNCAVSCYICVSVWGVSNLQIRRQRGMSTEGQVANRPVIKETKAVWSEARQQTNRPSWERHLLGIPTRMCLVAESDAIGPSWAADLIYFSFMFKLKCHPDSCISPKRDIIVVVKVLTIFFNDFL